MIQIMLQEECEALLRNNYIGRIAYIASGLPYVVPMTYYYRNQEKKSIILYSLEGHKINAMRKNRWVSFQVDEIESVAQWRSVLVQGEFEQLEQIDAKELLREFSQGVKAIVNRSPEKEVHFIHEFSSKLNANEGSPVVCRINIHEIIGRKRVMTKSKAQP